MMHLGARAAHASSEAAPPTPCRRSAAARVARAGCARRLLACAALAGFVAGCSHTYYFAGSSPPTIRNGELVIERFGERPKTRRINDVAVSLVGGGPRLATHDELAAWRRGEARPDVRAIAVEVSTTREVWLDYALPAAGIGMTLVLAIVAPFAGQFAASTDNGLTVPLVFLLAAVAGAEFGLIGAGIGALGEGGTSHADLLRR